MARSSICENAEILVLLQSRHKKLEVLLYNWLLYLLFAHSIYEFLECPYIKLFSQLLRCIDWYLAGCAPWV